MDNVSIETIKAADIREEINREYRKEKLKIALKQMIWLLTFVTAAAVIIASMFLPILEISGESMSPTLKNKDVVALVKGHSVHYGDIICFTWENKTLVKRVVAMQGDWVEIDKDGNVLVNSKVIEEPYVEKKDIGECDLEFPYQVPENSYFVLGDYRMNSVDSRNSAIGSVPKEKIVGKVRLIFLPLKDFGIIR